MEAIFLKIMNKLQVLLIIIISSYFVKAQEIAFSPGATFSKIDFEKKILELSNINIAYDYYFIKDTKNEKLTTTSTILSIGKNYIKFYDYNKFLFESNLDSINKLKSNYNSNDINTLFSFRRKIKFKPIILGQINNNAVIDFNFYDKINDNEYKYEYGEYKLDWKITTNSKKIGDYVCNEAILNYGGRKWITYYTEEIPLNYGPYIFNGLPGLILEIYDSKKEHHFVFNRIITDKNISIYVDNLYSNKSINKKDFIKGLKKFNENPSQFIGNSYSAPNVEEPTKSIPYNPIELE